MPTTGLVFDIERFATGDGPGIRTVVFLKGCPLHCAWCHNPESQKATPEIFFNADKCHYCGWCLEACPNHCHVNIDGKHVFNREQCTSCGLCTTRCYAEALEKVGVVKTVDDVFEDVLADKVFYETSGGGMTLSGGEPMAQFEFAKALLLRARQEGITACMETCGFAPYEHYREIIPLVQHFLYDVKLLDDTAHQRWTGVSNARIQENLRRLVADGATVTMTCPIIPGVNDTEEHLVGLADLANTLQRVEAIKIEPYHPLGISKCAKLGRAPGLDLEEFAPKDSVRKWEALVKAHTSVPVVVA